MIYFLVFLNFALGLQIKAESENEFYKREAKDMVNVVQRLILEGKNKMVYLGYDSTTW